MPACFAWMSSISRPRQLKPRSEAQLLRFPGAISASRSGQRTVGCSSLRSTAREGNLQLHTAAASPEISVADDLGRADTHYAAAPSQRQLSDADQQAEQLLRQETLVAAWTAQGRRGLVDSSGRLLLKNLTYEELHQWCQATGLLSCQVQTICIGEQSALS